MFAFPALDSGTTVRLQLLSGRRVTGKLLAPFARDSVRFRLCLYPAPPCVPGGERYAEQPAADVVELQIRNGTKAIPGLALGSAAGLGLGLLGIDFAESMGETKLSTAEKVTTVSLSVLLVGGLGLMIGGGLDRWRPLP